MVLRIDQLTFTRFIAALSIVIYHFGKDSFLFNNDYLRFIFKQANVGVSFFFVLSGFVMIIAYHHKNRVSFVEYMISRLARIYPVYILAIIVLYAIDLFRNINFGDFFLNAFLIQAWIPGKALTINYPGWSLSVEFFFYLLFPFLLNKIYRKSNLKLVALVVFVFWILSNLFINLRMLHIQVQLPLYTKQDLLYHPVLHLNAFLVGNLAALFFIHRLKDIRRNFLPHILLVIALLIILLKARSGVNFHNGILAVVFVPFILLVSMSIDPLTAIFKKRSFQFLGDISYGIYILQVPVWVVVSDYRLSTYLGLDPVNNFTFCFLLRLFLLILAASLSYRYFEKPVREKIRSVTKMI